MRISDWSSDVCSSDLLGRFLACLTGRTLGLGFRLLHLLLGLLILICPVVDRALRLFAAHAPLRQDVHGGFLVELLGYILRLPEELVEHIADILATLPRRLCGLRRAALGGPGRSEEHTSELQSLMRLSYAV